MQHRRCCEGEPAKRGGVSELLNSRAGRRRWFMLLLVSSVFFLSKADGSAISVGAPLIMDEHGLTSIELGMIFSAFSWAAALFAVPAGVVVDRFGAKLGLLLGLVTFSFGTFLIGFAGEFARIFAFLLVTRIFIGAAEAVVTPGSARVLATWFPDHERGRASSLWASVTYIATAVATPAMGWACYAYGWEPIFWFMGVIGIVFGLIWAWGYRQPADDPRLTKSEFVYIAQGGGLVADLGTENEKEELPRAGWPQLNHIGALLKSRQLQVIYFGQFCGNSIAMFLLVWMPTYLVKAHGISIVQAGLIMSLAGIMGGIAAVSGGFLTDIIYRRTGSFTLSRKASLTLGFSLTTLVLLLNIVEGIPALIGLLCLIYLGKGWSNTGWMLVADSAPPGHVGTVGGLLNLVGAIGATVSSIIIGYLVQATGNWDLAVIYVAAHGVLAIAAYWLLLGKMRRVSLPK